jgi:hypothetical protein
MVQLLGFLVGAAISWSNHPVGAEDSVGVIQLELDALRSVVQLELDNRCRVVQLELDVLCCDVQLELDVRLLNRSIKD